MNKCETCYNQKVCKNAAHPADGFCFDYESVDMTVRFPCRVGDTVYLIANGLIEPCTVEGIYFTRRRNYVRLRPCVQRYIGNHSVYFTPSFSSFGKTVFLLLENAEQALQELCERRKERT